MDRTRSNEGRRAAAFAAALLAITLNFLQPLVHAALMRDSGPATAGIWASICLPDADGRQLPEAGKVHECCLGLAHASVLAAPSAVVLVERLVAPSRVAADADVRTAVGIRDGPNQPRAPPSFPV